VPDHLLSLLRPPAFELEISLGQNTFKDASVLKSHPGGETRLAGGVACSDA